MKKVEFQRGEYATPLIIIYYTPVETGFSTSLEDPIENPEQDW